MGTGASNLSRSYLNTVQSSITRVGQTLTSEAKNNSEQQVTIRQTINFQNGPPISPCKEYLLQQRFCNNGCDNKDRPPIYQCQFSKTNANLTDNSTNPNNCDTVFGSTYEQALNYDDGICTGENTTVTENQRRTICTNRALRLMCPNNNTILSETDKFCVSSSDCVSGGECRNQVCWEPSGVSGSFNSTCDGGCGRTVYMLRTTRTDNGANVYDYGFAGDLIDNSDLPNCIGMSGGPCKIEIDGNEFFECVLADPGGSNRLNGISLEDCKKQCAEDFKCPDSIASQPPIMPEIICNGGLCIGNEANVRMDSEQMASSYINSQMTTNITNDFTSEVDKTISQTNEGLNFQQFNTSEEYTEIIQTIKNIVTNSISNQTENVSTQYSDTGQVINFVNNGRVLATTSSCNNPELDFSRCDDLDEDLKRQCQDEVIEEFNRNNNPNCVETGSSGSGGGAIGCACNITNSTVQDISNNQVAENILENIMDTDITNDLLSDYSLKVDQLNKGIDPFLMFLIIAIIIGIIAIVATYFIFKSLRLLLVVAIVLIIIGVPIYFFVIKPQTDKAKSEDKTIPPQVSLEQNVDVDVNVQS